MMVVLACLAAIASRPAVSALASAPSSSSFVRAASASAGGFAAAVVRRSPLAASASAPSSLLRMSSSSSSSSAERRGGSKEEAAAALSAAVESGISRLSTLRTLLSRAGAPGSGGCGLGGGDLIPCSDPDPDLHPHLYPLARSSSTGNYVCALRRAYANDQEEYESSSGLPWPIVESRSGARGYRLLALNSEHLMRRITAAADFGEGGNDDDDGAAAAGGGDGIEIPMIYNDGLGKGELDDPGLDAPYVPGSVDDLGYGLEKYVLLRVGPFPDLYESLSVQHAARGDEQSSLIAAEASNGKVSGFASTFAFYARQLSTFTAREDETRDAARVCLRLPVPSLGMLDEDYVDVSRLAGLSDPGDSTSDALEELRIMYEKIRQRSEEEGAGPGQNSKTPEQEAIDEANYLLDRLSLGGGDWASVRSDLGRIYRAAGREDMASFVDPGS